MKHHRFSELLHFPERIKRQRNFEFLFKLGHWHSMKEPSEKDEVWGPKEHRPLGRRGPLTPAVPGGSAPSPFPSTAPLPQLHLRPPSGPPPFRFTSQPTPAARTRRDLKASAGFDHSPRPPHSQRRSALTCDPSRSRERWRHQRPRLGGRGGAAP